MDDHAIHLTLRWRHTWPDQEDDFAAEAPGYDGSVGRIYLQEAGPLQGQWEWSMTAHAYDILRDASMHGVARSARTAAKEVEDCWFRAIKGSRCEGVAATSTETKINAYARASGGE
jgi:hypothetical protein